MLRGDRLGPQATAIVTVCSATCWRHAFVTCQRCNRSMHTAPCSAVLLRTPLAAQELACGGPLTLRQRSLLLMAEGTPRAQLEARFHGQGAALVQELLDCGYLAPACPSAWDEAGECDPALHVDCVRVQLQEWCERRLLPRSHMGAAPLRRLLAQARDLRGLQQAVECGLQWLERQGSTGDHLHRLRAQLQALLEPAWGPDLLEMGD